MPPQQGDWFATQDADWFAAQNAAAPVAEQPSTVPGAGFLDLAGEAVTRYVKGVIPVDLMRDLYDNVTGEFTKVQQSAASGDVLGALKHAVAGSPVGQATRITKQIGQAQLAQLQKAKQAYDAGNLELASAYTVAGALPLIGPMTTATGEEVRAGREAGDVKRQVGAVAELAGALTGPAAVKGVLPKSVRIPGTGAFANVNPAEVAAVQYGERAGIPISAATATGSPMVRSAQWLADRSLGGAIPAQRAAAAETAALRAQAGALTEQAAPGLPVTPETAGASLRGTLAGRVSDLAEQQRQQYGKVRELEVATAQPVQVGTERISRQFEGAEFDPHEDLLRAIARNGGIGLDKGMPGEIARLWESRTRGEGTIERMRTAGAREGGVSHGNAIGGVSGVIRREGGKSLDMMAEALREDGFQIEGPRQLLDAVEEARTARMRTPQAKPGQTDVFDEPIMETMGMPVDVGVVQVQLRPLYERLDRERQLVPLYGDKAKAFTALDRIMSGKKIQPASEVDAALSDLKKLSRFEGMAELRGAGKSIAAQAVGTLEEAVQQAVATGGPEATAARTAGRRATIEKYETGRLLKELKTEPVVAYRKATQPGDAAIDYLRQVASVAPQEMPKIGRAYLSSVFEKATKKGGFDKAATLFNDWQKLGPETKRTLFPDRQLRSDLDNFFLLSERMSVNPNPSGTAYGAALTAQGMAFWNPIAGTTYALSTAAIAKLLHSKAGVRLLTEAVRIPVSRKIAKAAAVSRAAAVAGVRPSAAPAMAEKQEQ